jgi:hypothetical protein
MAPDLRGFSSPPTLAEKQRQVAEKRKADMAASKGGEAVAPANPATGK